MAAVIVATRSAPLAWVAIDRIGKVRVVVLFVLHAHARSSSPGALALHVVWRKDAALPQPLPNGGALDTLGLCEIADDI
jgi:hypothetical protein